MSERLVAASADVAGGDGTLIQRLRASLVDVLSRVACRLPEAPLVRLADLAGNLWYRVDTRRAAQGRANLRRVCEWLTAHDTGPERARNAAANPKALERLLRAAFRQQARYYLEVARTPGIDARYVRERLIAETPDAVDAAFAQGGPMIFVGMHFGAIELPALLLAVRSEKTATGVMETINDPPLQRYFVKSRGSVGIRIVGLREARRELTAALRRGEPVGLVADRDISGGGIDVPFFGVPAPLPVGPALLALETDAPVYLATVRRAGIGRYLGRLERLQMPSEGTRRERITAFLEAEAHAFERAIAFAPEQWWGAFFPIWPDSSGRTPNAAHAVEVVDEVEARAAS